MNAPAPPEKPCKFKRLARVCWHGIDSRPKILRNLTIIRCVFCFGLTFYPKE